MNTSCLAHVCRLKQRSAGAFFRAHVAAAAGRVEEVAGVRGHLLGVELFHAAPLGSLALQRRCLRQHTTKEGKAVSDLAQVMRSWV